jgi:pimeloyl-ACP methyl ester carboxylesterase
MAEGWNLESFSMLSDLIKSPMTFLTTFTLKNIAKCLPLLLPCIYFLLKHRTTKTKQSLGEEDSADDGTDPGLLKKHSSYDSYHVPKTGVTYPSIRTFYRPHPHGDKLPVIPTPVPLLVCVHGLGGSVAQFHPLLSSLVNLAPTLAIDLPGCGLSSFRPRAWKAYTTDALVQLLAVIIEKHRDVEAGQGVVLVGHSMGCSLTALLASSTSPYNDLISDHVRCVIAICPAAEPPSPKKVSIFRKLLLIPGPIFDLWRRWDRRGGAESASIARFTGPNAEEKTKKLQLLFNKQSRTPVWRRMASGVLPDYSSGLPIGGLPGKDIWMGLKIPVLLIAGQADHVTPPENVRTIARWFGREDEVKGCNDLKFEKGMLFLLPYTNRSSKRRSLGISDVRLIVSFNKAYQILLAFWLKKTPTWKRPALLTHICRPSARKWCHQSCEQSSTSRHR